MANSLIPFLMFTGACEEAINFYVGLFPEAEVTVLERYGVGEQGAEGTVKRAAFTIAGQPLLAIDSPPVHAFTFTPSISLAVDYEDEAELDRLVGELAVDGAILMPPSNYGFSRKFAWLNDRFGVSWQLNLQ
jgi:predicted 3-demethylubiquinone-9 3-methyltransferase (glyoxalase superfamily)